MPITSILKAGIDALPDKARIKGQALPNVLKKQGVKDEELKFAGLEIKPEKSYTKAELQELEAGRKDVFGKEESQGYNFVSLEAGLNNPTYKENVYTFAEGKGGTVTAKQKLQEEYVTLAEDSGISMDQALDMSIDDVAYAIEGRNPEGASRMLQIAEEWDNAGYGLYDKAGSDSRYTSEHYPDVPNYLMHTRTYDDTLDGTPTRVLQEIQSDLHQQARAAGGYGGGGELSSEEIAVMKRYLRGGPDSPNFEQDMVVAEDALRRFFSEDEIDELGAPDLIEELITNKGRAGIPESPYQKSWLAKGIERELDSAINEGRQQLAIPIKGAGIENLKRAPGVQDWYENNVVNTAKKIAKQNNMDFELQTTGSKKLNSLDLTTLVKDYHNNKGFSELRAAKVLRTELMSIGLLNPEKIDKVVQGITTSQPMKEYIDAFTSDGTQYAIIKPKKVPGTGVLKGEEPELALKEVLGQATPEDVKRLESLEREREGYFKRPDLKLYSSPAAALGAAYGAMKQGQDPQAILIEQGYDEDEVNSILADAKILEEGVAVGFDEQELITELSLDEPEIADISTTPVTTVPEKSFWDRVEATMEAYQGNPKRDAYASIVGDAKISPEQLVSRLRTIQPNMSSITTRISGYAGNEVDFNKARQAVESSVQRIVNMAQERGVNLVWVPPEEVGLIETLEASGGGKFMLETDQGRVDVTPGFWESMREEQHEIGYGVAGAFAGAKTVAQWSKHPIAIGAGSVLGAVIGASGGTELDYLRDAVVLTEDMSAEVAAHKVLTATEASVVGDLVGYPLAKSAGLIWDGVKRAKDLILDGNIEGALQSLKSTMFIDDASAKEMVERLNRATIEDVKTIKPAEQQIKATLLTEPGGEAIVQPAGVLDPQAGRAVAESIKRRAQDVLATTAELTDENVAKILTEDLANYTSNVKQFYGDVKEQVSLSPRINNFSFDYDKLAINPVLETLSKNITDPNVLEKFRLQAQKIRDMSDSRTLTDLIELRQIVNDFKFNTRISKAKDFKQLNNILGDIDGAIKQGAEVVMENPKQWLKDYSQAKIDYAQMKGLEKNVLAKLLRRPGISQDLVVKSLTKYITALDGTFNDVLSKLPTKQRAISEGAVIDALAQKFAVKDEAIHFPLLADELNKVVFTTPEARKAKAALNELAQVFKNDIPLAQAAGNIQIPKFQSFLTADPVMRAKFEFATSMFNGIKKRLPTQKAGNIALVTKTAKLLEEPLNAKAMKDFMEASDGDVNLTKMATDLQKEAARAKATGKDIGSAKVIMYGDGETLKTSGKGKSHSIPIHRIASYEKVREIADKYAIDLNDKVQLNGALKDEGYMAVQAGTDQVRRLK